MIVVADSGPIIHLSAAGQLHLLPALFGRVVVPKAVWREVVEVGAGRVGAAELAAADWADVVDGGDPQLRAALERDLDVGEASALAVAVERPADLVLTDERGARLAARRSPPPTRGNGLRGDHGRPEWMILELGGLAERAPPM